MRLLVGALMGGLLAAQVPRGEPLVFGPQAAWLRPVDAEAVGRAVAPYGGAAWLITEVRRYLQRTGEFRWSAMAYVAPTITTSEFRRGRLVHVSTGLTAEQLADPSSWSADPTTVQEWAQVAIPGRPFEDVKNEQDENLPLWISGDITDADLVSIVRFLRSRPAITVRPGLNLGHVPGPIRGIRAPAIRHPFLPAARVSLGLGGGRCSYDVVLERRDSQWVGGEVGDGVGCP